MKQIMKTIFVLIILLITPSCDYQQIKNENKRLTEELIKIKQIEEERRLKKEHENYIKSLKKYAVVVNKYNRLVSVSRERGPKYAVKWHISNVVEVSLNMTRDEEARVIDQNTLTFNTEMMGYKSYILEKKIHYFNTYSEASDFISTQNILIQNK